MKVIMCVIIYYGIQTTFTCAILKAMICRKLTEALACLMVIYN